MRECFAGPQHVARLPRHARRQWGRLFVRKAHYVPHLGRSCRRQEEARRRGDEWPRVADAWLDVVFNRYQRRSPADEGAAQQALDDAIVEHSGQAARVGAELDENVEAGPDPPDPLPPHQAAATTPVLAHAPPPGQ